MNSYHDFLKEELNNFGGNFPKFILNIPELFELLCNILEEESIDKESKRKINSALAYFVLPNDVISEDLYGPAGYIDDIFACSVVLKEINETYGSDLLKKHWDGEEDIIEVVNDCYNLSLKELNAKENLSETVLKFASLD